MNFWRLRHQIALGLDRQQGINYDDQHLRQNASPHSINWRFLPPFEDENLFEQPEPPLLSIGTWRWLALRFVIRNPGVNTAIIGRVIAVDVVN
jgi:hypothetical protein